jgi:hypothetical protein
MLTIAHKIEIIMVIDGGEYLEFDTPKKSARKF